MQELQALDMMRKQTEIKRSRRGFMQTGALLTSRLRGVAESRGFAETRLLTQWAEIAGPEFADIVTPVKVTYGREGFGATLVLLCSGARGPEVTMQLPVIKERVNACYGYNAISHVRITQTAPIGFSEKQQEFSPKVPAPRAVSAAQNHTSEVSDDGLRDALQKLGANILSRPSTQKTNV